MTTLRQIFDKEPSPVSLDERRLFTFEEIKRNVKEWIKQNHNEWREKIQYEEMYIEEVLPRLARILDNPIQEQKEVKE